ncbi:MAG: hypothetical protein RJA63_1936 [Pseudomonadota bacterium]
MGKHMGRWSHWLVALLCLVLAHRSSALEVPTLDTKAALDAASGAYGFCLGQRYSLDEVARVHPELAPRVAVVADRFDASLGQGCTNIESALRQRLKRYQGMDVDAYMLDMQKSMREQLKPSLEMVRDRSVSEAFLDEVQSRADGKLDETIARALLEASQFYLKAPHQSWPRWTSMWSSRGHARGHGVRVRVRVPTLLTPAEPNAAHMLQKWTRALDDGAGHVMLAISVWPFEGGETMAEVLQEFRADPEGVAEALFSSMNATHRHWTPVTSLGRPALLFEMEVEAAQLTLTFRQRIQQLMAVVPQGVVTLHCSVLVEVSRAETLSDWAERYEPLCSQFFNSASEEQQ